MDILFPFKFENNSLLAFYMVLREWKIGKSPCNNTKKNKRKS